jgi:hypothetical protein
MAGPRDPQVWGPAAIALAALVVPPVKGLVRPAVTAVHEAGHVVVGMATGRVVTGVTITADGIQSGGATGHRGPLYGPSRILTSAAGYPAPSMAGLGLAYLLHQKYQPLALLVAAMIFFGLLFLLMRNLTGIVVVGALAFAAYLVVYRAGAPFQLQAARTVTWFLLLGGVTACSSCARSGSPVSVGATPITSSSRP